MHDIVFNIGGGPRNGRAIKAAQTGGPSGGCLPVSKFDLPVDFDALTKAGSMMGSGGMIVMDEETCMVDLARYFVDFLKGESCGKCTPCREGTYWMMHLIERISQGNATMNDVMLLQDVANQLKGKCLCALGEFSTMPVTTALERFRMEFPASAGGPA
jgi:NADH:ubiquinone oxidoreductase subunit F (NADH-binding)